MPASSHIRRRFSMPSSRPMRNSRTHIAQGLNPSAAAIAIVSSGNERSDVSVGPISGNEIVAGRLRRTVGG
ncbi:hypothetical protein D3C83_176500 [compost metagenome]